MQPEFKKSFTAVSKQISFFMAWSNLKFKKLRTLLTIAGVTVGIGSIFFLLSLGLGLQNLVTHEIIGSQSVKTLDVTSPNSAIIKIDQQNSEKIKNLPNVDHVGGSFDSSGTIKLNGSETDTIVYGVDESYHSIASLDLIKGKFFANEETDRVVINSAGLEILGIGADQAIGKTMELIVFIEKADSVQEVSQKYKVIGVTDSGSGSEVFIPRSLFDANKVTNYSQIKVVADNIDNISEIRSKIESLGFITTSPLDTIQQISKLFNYINIILIGFGSIGMLVAILGMFNTLTISLLERTREIGLMIALGVRNRDIRRLFIYESILLSVIGSMLGILLAVFGGILINLVMKTVVARRGFNETFSIISVPWWLPIILIIFMIVVGLGVSYFPARRAEKISPVDALRDDQ